MAIQTLNTAQAVEAEMTNYQRNLVDTCFEEGNCDSAISLLDNLRHPSTKPCPAHIRNVVYIALHPPPSAEDDHRVSRMDSIPSSPSKFAARHPGTSHSPTVSASEAAQRLLEAYASTNSPGSLLRALPGYGLSDLQGLGSLLPDICAGDDDSDSETARLSRRILDAKNCWGILREGFARSDAPGSEVVVNSARSSRRGQRDDMSGREGSPSDVPAPVGPHAWPVLAWLLTVFENDEAISVASGQPRYSPMLLSQIPSSRSASSSRWDIEAPLNIAFYSLEQRGRSSLGIRLLALLINLTGTIFVDATMILNAVCTRTMRLTATTLRTLFDYLPLSLTTNRFQVSLCKLCLAGTSCNATTRKAKPRAAPRPLPARQRPDAASEAAVKEETTAAKQETISRVLPSPSAPEIVQLLSNPYKAIPPDVAGQLKCHLTCSFAALQAQLPLDSQDSTWQLMLENGELSRILGGVFANETDPVVLEDIRAIASVPGSTR